MEKLYMRISSVEPCDYQQILDIYNWYIENTTITFEIDKLTIEEFTLRIERIIKEYPYLVIKEGDRVLGYGYLDHFNPRKAYDITADLSIYLDHNVLHQHLGQQILDALIIEAKKQNITNIISIITSENTNSIHFHEKNGFIKRAYLNKVGIKFGRVLDVSFYQKYI